MENKLSVSDIERASIIVHIKGKKYAMVPQEGKDKKECEQLRRGLAIMLLKDHALVEISKATIELATKKLNEGT